MRRLLPVLVVLALAGCGQAQVGSPAAPKEDPVEVTTLTAQQLADAQRELGLDLLAKACAAAPDENVALSPASVGIALGILDAGARGPALASMAALLHLPPWSPAVLAAFRAQRVSLQAMKQVQTSNHLYAQPGLDSEQETLDDIRTAFGAGLEELDFGDLDHALDVINSQVKKDTKGLIPTLLSDLDPATVTVLTNAIHLDAAWAVPFEKATPGEFTTAAGTTVQVPTMTNESEFPHRTTGGWDSVQLDYKGGALSAFALLPPKGGACEATAAQVKALTTGAVKDQVPTALPTLKLSQTHHLLRDLLALGMPVSGFEGFGSDLEVDEVIQKVVIDVDEAGTKAAAATAIGVRTTSARLTPDPVVFDRPFLLLLQDTATGTPLFLVRVADPTPR